MDFRSGNALCLQAAPHQTAGREIAFELQGAIHFSGIEKVEQSITQMHQFFGEESLFRVVEVIGGKPAHLFCIDQLGCHFVVERLFVTGTDMVIHPAGELRSAGINRNK